MTLSELIDHLTTMEETGPERGNYQVFMVIDDNGNTAPVECPIISGRKILLYDEKIFTS